jgi:hypothetical protein
MVVAVVAPETTVVVVVANVVLALTGALLAFQGNHGS